MLIRNVKCGSKDLFSFSFFFFLFPHLFIYLFIYLFTYFSNFSLINKNMWSANWRIIHMIKITPELLSCTSLYSLTVHLTADKTIRDDYNPHFFSHYTHMMINPMSQWTINVLSILVNTEHWTLFKENGYFYHL